MRRIVGDRIDLAGAIAIFEIGSRPITFAIVSASADPLMTDKEATTWIKPWSKILIARLSAAFFQENIEGSVTRGPRGGLSFRRTISTDDVALDALINELKLRRVYVPRDHVVILTEWDNPYQSRLVADFEAAARREQKLTEPKLIVEGEVRRMEF